MSRRVLILEAAAKASLPVIESCKAQGYHVVAGASQKYGCGLFSRHVDERVYYPSPVEAPDACFDAILGFLKSVNVDVLLPCGDAMTDLVAQRQDELVKLTGFILPKYQDFIKGRNKVATLKTAQEAGCPIPETWFPDEETVETIAGRIQSWPVLVKPAISAGSRGIKFCHNSHELIQNYRQIQTQYGQTFVQDFVPPGGTQYKADMVMDRSQNLVAGVVYAKLRYYPPDGGSSVLNRTEKHPAIHGYCVSMMKRLNWQGLCDFDFIVDPRDGVAKLMEINPRFPESYRTTVAAGVDMTKTLCQLALGEAPEPQLDYVEGKYNRFLFGDILWFLRTRENRWRAKPNFFRFFDKDTYYQLLRKDDLGPIWGYIRENWELMKDKKARANRLRWRR